MHPHFRGIIIQSQPECSILGEVRLSQVICAIRANNFCYKEVHYYMAMYSKSFYSALLWGANLTSNTLETLRMEGSAFKISLYLHAKPILRNTTYLCNFFYLHNIYFFNFCMEISAEKKNSSKKRKKMILVSTI